MDKRLFFPATQRNSKPIEKVLTTYLPKQGTVLEIASGSGEHAVTFQKCFPHITWQSSDPNLIHRNSISAWIKHLGLNPAMPYPLDLNVESRPWPLPFSISSTIRSIVTINLIHTLFK